MMLHPPDKVNKTPTRVLVMLDSLRAGGAERVAVEAACALDRDRFEPHVLVTRYGGPLEDVLRRAGVRYTVLGRRRGFSPRRLARAHTLVRGSELLHTHMLGSALWGGLLARAARRPLVVHEHTWSGEQSRMRSVGYRRWLTPFASRIVCVSELVARSVTADGGRPGQVTVIHNGVRVESALPREEARRELDLPADAVVVGIVARLRPEKAHEVLIRAVARLGSEEARDVVLCVVGDGERRDELQSLAGDLGIAERVVWAGERPDAARLASAFDVAVICSWWEGLPLAALEALAGGVPLVATSVGALPELLSDDAGVLVPPGDERALSAAIGALAADAEARERIGKRGLERVRADYSFEGMISALERLYDEVLGRGGER
jgi:glycosyltransferase involved in cell wall biosynthesis